MHHRARGEMDEGGKSCTGERGARAPRFFSLGYSVIGDSDVAVTPYKDKFYLNI